jgi:mRNA interferase MazF
MQLDGQDGVVLSDQVKSLDWKVRRAKKKGAVPEAVVLEVRARIKALLVIK